MHLAVQKVWMLVLGKETSTLTTLHEIANFVNNETRKIVSSNQYQRLARCSVGHVYFRSSLRILMMMMMNCFCGMVDRRKAFSLISSRDHCQRSSPSRISDTPRAGFEPAQNLSSGFCWMKLCSSDNHYDKWYGSVMFMIVLKCNVMSSFWV